VRAHGKVVGRLAQLRLHRQQLALWGDGGSLRLGRLCVRYMCGHRWLIGLVLVGLVVVHKVAERDRVSQSALGAVLSRRMSGEGTWGRGHGAGRVWGQTAQMQVRKQLGCHRLWSAAARRTWWWVCAAQTGAATAE
jgi:hypothetical protein